MHVFSTHNLFKSFLLLFAIMLFSGCGVLKWSEVRPHIADNKPSKTYKASQPNKVEIKRETPKKTQPNTVVSPAPTKVERPKNAPKNTPSARKKTDALLDVYRQWKGTPYRLGGNSRSGIDCSAFMQQTYQSAFSASLPRTTKEQFRQGKPISQKELQVGDLVFFQTSNSTWHVGVYLGDRQFMHASVTYGVSVANLDNGYWQKRYKGARRILQ